MNLPILWYGLLTALYSQFSPEPELAVVLEEYSGLVEGRMGEVLGQLQTQVQ